MIDITSATPAPMPSQQVWGANLVGIALVLLVLWLFAEFCWPVRLDAEDAADA